MEKEKKTIRVDFRHFWWYFNPENNIFINLLRKDYNVIIDKENPDYVFFSVFTKDRPIHSKTYGGIGKSIDKHFPILYKLLREMYYFNKERWKMPTLKGYFVKIFYTGENARPNMEKCDWAFTFDYDEELKNPRHLRLPLYYFGGSIKGLDKKKNINKIKKEKIKFCAFVCDHKINFREKFFKKLSKHKRVDAPGLSMRNMVPEKSKIGNTGDGEKGKYKNKIKFLDPYKFEIVFENTSYPGYTTDRICHAMYANAIPIYWGNPLVYRDFNTKSFINYHDFEKEVKENIPKMFFKIPVVRWLTKKYIENYTMNKMIKRIIEIDNNNEIYESYLRQPWCTKENKKYFNEIFLRKRLHEIFK